MWTLTLRTPDGAPRVFTVKRGKTSIGRLDQNDIVLSDVSGSRRHAEIEYDPLGEILTIRDLGSTNGTYVNRERLTGTKRLNHNDVIRIGEDVINVAYHDTAEPIGLRNFGTQPLTREVLLESIDQHAVLLYEVSRRLNTVLDIETALREVASGMQRAMGADKCELILKEDFNRLSDLGFPTSIAKMAIDQRSTIIIPDLSAQGDMVGKSAYLLRIRSALCVPVITGDEILGLIYMYKTDPGARPFEQRDVQLAVAISHQAALTIQRMQLIQQVQEEQQVRQLLQRFVSPLEADFIMQEYIHTGQLPELAERTVTVLFADIADSTGLAERLGPKRFGEILRIYYEDMTNIVFENGGLVDKYLGDGLMAVFGMTEKKPDPEGRAVVAGIRMLEQVEHLNKENQDKIVIGIGINTGPVVAGYVGTMQRVELTVLGDTVNVASGLQGNARPNRLLVGPATVAAIIGRFNMIRVGAITVKGRLRDIQAYEVIREHSQGALPNN
jgi:adenylate cyclase